MKDILEGRELRVLQTDGYNVYLYLGNEILDIDHVCCMAHVRAKFKYTAEIEQEYPGFSSTLVKLYPQEKRYMEQNSARIRPLANGRRTRFTSAATRWRVSARPTTPSCLLQTSGESNLGIPQKILCRDNREQP